MNSIIMNNTALDAKEHDRLVGITVQGMRRSLGVSAGELARASGIPCPGIEAIERGGAATRSERHDIVAALGWLSSNRVARGPTAAGRGCSAPADQTGLQTHSPTANRDLGTAAHTATTCSLVR